jgi:hypothetical protein
LFDLGIEGSELLLDDLDRREEIFDDPIKERNVVV